MNHITIIGAGKYGTALAYVFSKNPDNKILLYSSDIKKVDDINTNNQNSKIYPNKKLPENITASNNLQKVVEKAGIIILAIPAGAIEKTIKEVIKFKKEKVFIINTSKGSASQTELITPSAIYTKFIKKEYYYTLSGPGFADEIMQDAKTIVTLAGHPYTKIIREKLKNPNLKIELSDNAMGVEICGILKNVLAINTGIYNEYSINTKTALLMQGIKEIREILKYENVSEETILTSAGIGDIILTALTTKSRNYSFGKLINEGKSTNEALNEINSTVEGFNALKSLEQYLQDKKIQAPLLKTTYKIVIDQADPKKLLDQIL